MVFVLFYILVLILLSPFVVIGFIAYHICMAVAVGWEMADARAAVVDVTYSMEINGD